MKKEPKKIYLCKPNNRKYAQLNGVDENTVSFSKELKDYSKIEFDVDRYIQIENKTYESNGYEDLHDKMEIYLEGIGLFKMQEPSLNNDGVKESKHVIAYSVEKELESYKLTDVLINTGKAGSYEFLAKTNEGKTWLNSDFKPITFYNEDKDLSLLDIILLKAVGWSVGHVDKSLKGKKLTFEIDENGIYGFLTSTLAYKASCVFTFDTINRKVNAYVVESYGKDTNIFISYRNLLNSIDMETEEDSVITRYTILGDGDLDIRNVNFGSRYIDDLSYYKTTAYMTQEMIDKINGWESYKEQNRDSYIDSIKKISDYEEKITEIKYRLPSGDCTDYKKFEGMKKEELDLLIEKFNLELEFLRISVDAFPKYKDQNNKSGYIPWTKPDGTINNEAYEDLLKKQSNGYGGYYTYIQINNYIIPNIRIAISNINVPDDKKIDYVKAFETNWELYGTVELENKKKLYEDEIVKGSLDKYSKRWEDMDASERAKFNDTEEQYKIYHDEYAKYIQYLGSETTDGTLLYTLKKLEDEILRLEDNLTKEKQNRDEILSNVDMKNSKFRFTDEEIKIYNILITEETYTNNNFLTTSLDTNATKIEVQKKLFEDGKSKLYEVSRPQYTFSTDIDNLLMLDEFSEWAESFDIGSFIRVTVREDYPIKLRLVSMEYNPCVPNSNLTVGYSSMILSKGGRNDFTYMLDGDSNSSGGSSSTSSSSSSSSDINDVIDLLKMLNKTDLFKTSITGIVDQTLVDSGKINSLISDYVNSAYIEADKLKVNQAWINELFATNITATGNITGGTFTGSVMQSSNYEMNNEVYIDEYGNVNSNYVVKEGLKIDLDHKKITTPQMEIANNYMNLKGYFTNGTRKSGDIGYLSFSNGINNLLKGASCAAIGNENTIGGDIQYNRIYTREGLTFSISSSSEYTTMPDGDYVEDLTSLPYADILLSMSYTTYWNDTGVNLYEGSMDEMLYSGTVYNYGNSGIVINTPYEIWTNIITGDDGNVLRLNIDKSNLVELLNNKYVDIYNGYYKISISLNSYSIILSGKNGFSNWCSAVVGKGLVSMYSNQFICGCYNSNRRDALFEVGMGDSKNRKNAFVVDYYGKAWSYSDIISGRHMYVPNEQGYLCRDTSGVGRYMAMIDKNNNSYIATNLLSGNLTIGSKEKALDTIIGKYVEIKGTQYSGSSVKHGGNCFYSSVTGKNDLGNSAYKWKNLFLTGSAYANGGSTALTSDRRVKYDIRQLDKWKELIMRLSPIWFKYIYGESGRDHTGLVAQQVESTLNYLGLENSAIVCKIPKDPNKELDDCNENEIEYALRYEEFIAPIISCVQDIYKEIDGIKEKMEE